MKRTENKKRVILTIAGSDSGGGAGIQADLKVFAALGTFGASAITALTAQNTKGVRSIQNATMKSLRDQIEAVLEDMNVAAIKTGMIPGPGHVKAVAAALAGTKAPLVVDPVLVATTGAELAGQKTVDAMAKHLFPIARVITPNLMEAGAILGRTVESVEEQTAAARDLAGRDLAARHPASDGHAWAVVTGGDRSGRRATDVLASSEGDVRLFRSRRIPGGNSHGSGCMFASAIAAHLALGRDVPEAVHRAKRFVANALAHAVRPGKGHGSPDPFGGRE
ncbi:MAG: bifunctional hydroxymethylpyrimidine kinase/phosphomethylpyrimidine kinase [Gemmatimonadetes bacterium]|nr:bifunctional hydroxymethylpyrimidine kinase/phosphomethylpyrimidine kinase [Gemmatimonadota bacterium]